MITCDDIEGRCCSSCHEDAQEGFDGGEMSMIYESDAMNAPCFAHVCCAKVDDARRMLASYLRMKN